VLKSQRDGGIPEPGPAIINTGPSQVLLAELY